MNKIAWLKLINTLLLVSFLAQVASSLLLIFRFSETAATFHKYNGLLFILLASLHIGLNWGWIRSVMFKRGK
jgi:hypothetical protein